jgi:hypothetical protein
MRTCANTGGHGCAAGHWTIRPAPHARADRFRELWSRHATGDASQLLLQAAALLIFLSVLFLLPENYFRGDLHPQARLTLAWSTERFLIATRMLVVGLFAILSWDNLSVANCRSCRKDA